MLEPVLKVKNLVTELLLTGRRVKVVDHLSLELYKGQTLAIVGESGCGKSMAALSLMRLLPQPPALPSKGEIIYREKNLLEASEKEMRSIRGARIAMIFQDPTTALNPVYTIEEQLIEVLEFHLSLFGEEAYLRALSSLKEVGISSPEQVLMAYPHQLSGGMRQRVMIAMALICSPDILIADEPTTALDVTIQAQVLELIKDLQQRNGMAVLMITHDMGVVAEMANEVIVMYAAEEIEKASVYDLFDYPSHPYTQALFQARPSLTRERKVFYPIAGNVPSPAHYPRGCRFHPRCPFVMPVCKHGEVPSFAAPGNSMHSTHCWLLDPEQKGLKT